ncbi:unnamed protein product [Pleuronectes platessa]|uniref:Uncharacterized protein n=1 Tax=Pleuronectes platessa TaxID=8262 RepID=A0A9N7UJX1_PLEPL|nr:unnamed protein product [Pleuronectes platessa]
MRPELLPPTAVPGPLQPAPAYCTADGHRPARQDKGPPTSDASGPDGWLPARQRAKITLPIPVVKTSERKIALVRRLRPPPPRTRSERHSEIRACSREVGHAQ